MIHCLVARQDVDVVWWFLDGLQGKTTLSNSASSAVITCRWIHEVFSNGLELVTAIRLINIPIKADTVSITHDLSNNEVNTTEYFVRIPPMTGTRR